MSFPTCCPVSTTSRWRWTAFESPHGIVELQIQQTIRLDFRLELGSLSETVTATGTAPMLNTEDVTLGTVIENRRIVELPLNGRNFLKMVELTPNVSASFSGSGSSGPRQGGDDHASSFR